MFVSHGAAGQGQPQGVAGQQGFTIGQHGAAGQGQAFWQQGFA